MYCNGLLEFKTVARILVKSAAGYEYKCPVCGDSGVRKTRPKLGARCRVKVIPDSELCDFAAVVLKGLVEHQDPSAYFGSTGGVGYHSGEAEERGWIVRDARGFPLASTPAGRAHYVASGLDKLGPRAPEGWADGKPRRFSRAYLWDWSGYKPSQRRIVLDFVIVGGKSRRRLKWAFTALEAARAKAIELVGKKPKLSEALGCAVARNGDCLFIIGATFEEIFQ